MSEKIFVLDGICCVCMGLLDTLRVFWGFPGEIGFAFRSLSFSPSFHRVR